MKPNGDSFLGSFYENFFGRDLAYIMGGAIVVFSSQYAYVGDLRPMADWIVSHGIASLIFFLGGSYLVGFILKEFLSGTPFKLFLTRVGGDDVNNTEEFDPYKELKTTNVASRILSARSIRGLERYIFLETIAASVGSSSLVSFLVLVSAAVFRFNRTSPTLRGSWLMPMLLVQLLAFVWCLCYNRRRAKNRRALYDIIRKETVKEGYPWTLAEPTEVSRRAAVAGTNDTETEEP